MDKPFLENEQKEFEARKLFAKILLEMCGMYGSIFAEGFERGFNDSIDTKSEREDQMTFDAYQKAAMRTAPEIAQDEMIINTALGLTGESGEFADRVKKIKYQGHQKDREALLKELGDILWYVALGATALGVNMDDIASGNIKKLKERYPNGFRVENSVFRLE